MSKDFSFYVIDNAKREGSLERFSDFGKAIEAFSLLKSGGSALGVEVSTGAIDLIHKINGENVLVEDYLNINRFSEEMQDLKEELSSFVRKLIDDGVVSHRYNHSIVPWRNHSVKVVVPIAPEFAPDAYCKDKTLKAADGIPATAINEILVDGDGWVNYKDFLNDPSKYVENGVLKVEMLNVAYVKSDKYVGVDGQMDLSVDNFEVMAERVNKPYYISVSDARNSRYDRSNFAVMSFDTLPEAVKAWYKVNENTEFTPGVMDRKAGACVFNGVDNNFEKITYEQAAEIYGFDLDKDFAKDKGFCINPLKDTERSFTFRQSDEINSDAGLVGFLRGDFGSGKEFWTTWNEFSESRKTKAFANELDTVINALRFDEKYNGILKDRDSLSRYCWGHRDAAYEDGRNNYGVRIDTDNFSYLLRLNPNKGDYNFYCYCYEKKMLNEYLHNAEKVSDVDKLIDNAVKASKNTMGDGNVKDSIDKEFE